MSTQEELEEKTKKYGRLTRKRLLEIIVDYEERINQLELDTANACEFSHLTKEAFDAWTENIQLNTKRIEELMCLHPVHFREVIPKNDIIGDVAFFVRQFSSLHKHKKEVKEC